jgi:hypothetical protein
MQLYSECIVCLFQQALRIAKLTTPDQYQQWTILHRLSKEIAELPINTIQVEVAGKIRQIIAETTGETDPYCEQKKYYNNVALGLYPRLQSIVEQSSDPLLSAIRIAIAGNIIDFGLGDTFNLEQTVEESLTEDFAIFDYSQFQEKLKRADTILYLADNTGEIVFDRLLIDFLQKQGKQVAIAVRGAPVLNDATLEDADAIGLVNQCEVISNGAALPGTVLSETSSLFQQYFHQADLIIAKGQGNFEGLFEVEAPLTFLFKAKCEPIARELGVSVGSMVFYQR